MQNMSAENDLIPVKEPEEGPIETQQQQQKWCEGPSFHTLPHRHRIMVVRVPHEDDESLASLTIKAIKVLYRERVCYLGCRTAVGPSESLKPARFYCSDTTRCK